MASVYQIKYTDGIRTITIQPGTLNGPGGVLSDTDLQLYGQGTLAWGAGVDQNLLRLIENFACPESILVPGEPMGDAEIGVVGAGINNPNEGQQWFNTTDSKLYFYDGSVWVPGGSVFQGATAPVSPVVGTLWYDTSVQVDGHPGQLKVYTAGLVFESVAERYVLKDGDTLTGNLQMSSNEILGLPGTPSATGAASKEYVDTQIAALSGSATLSFVDAAGDNMTGDLAINKSNSELRLNALSNTYAAVKLQDGGTERGDLFLDATSNDVAVRRGVDGSTSEIRLRSTYIDTTATANGKIRTPATAGGDNALTVTTKGYVDGEIAAATAGGATIYGSLVSTNVAGDIAVTGGKIYIALATNNWKQVWPAVYS
jgi:hypothetical protein